MILILKIQEVKPDKVKGLVQGYIAKDSRDVNGGASGSHTQALSSPPSASAAERRDRWGSQCLARQEMRQPWISGDSHMLGNHPFPLLLRQK